MHKSIKLISLLFFLSTTGCDNLLTGLNDSRITNSGTSSKDTDNPSCTYSTVPLNFHIRNLAAGFCATDFPTFGSPKVGMSFVATQTGRLNGMILDIFNSGANPMADIYFGEDPGEGVELSTPILSNHPIPANLSGDGSGGNDVSISFSSPVEVQAGVRYRIEITQANGSDAFALTSPDENTSEVLKTSGGTSSAVSGFADCGAFAFSLPEIDQCQ